VDGIPGERRRLLDHVSLYCRPELARCYHAYLRCLMQRGRLLRQGRAHQEVEVWEHQMVAHGLTVMRIRGEVIADLNRELAAEQELTEKQVCMAIRPTAPEVESEWMKKLASQRRSSQQRGILRIGPHCDRLIIDYGSRDIRACGSRGQQKLTAVALRLAECRLRMQHRGLVPVLLLDDSLEALDPVRQHRLLERLARQPGQILMTGPTGTRRPGSLGIHRYDLAAESSKARMMVPVVAGVEEAA
jgi:DNA replication and repair protein RecF